MPRPYSQDLRERVIGAVEAGASARAAGRLFGVSESAAVKWVQRWRRTGSVSAKQMGGYKRSGLDAHAPVLMGLVADCPDLTLEEIRAELRQRGIRAGHASVWRFFKRHAITVKKNRAGQRTEAPGRRRRPPPMAPPAGGT